MNTIFLLSSENEQEVKSKLINKGFPEEVVNALEYGYYRINEDRITPITKTEFALEKSGKVVVMGTSTAVGVTTVGAAYCCNSQLNIEHYGDRNEDGKPTGHGYSFEDIANRKAKSEGKTVDATVGKTHEKGGVDAVVDGEDVQYKCCSDTQRTADKIEDRDGYPGQKIVVNTELAEPLKRELERREKAGKVPVGTAARVVDSGISIVTAKRVAKPFTKESLLFDAKTALPTLGIAFIGSSSISLIWDNVKGEGINKTTFKRALKRGTICGGIAFLGHIAYNQIRRVL